MAEQGDVGRHQLRDRGRVPGIGRRLRVDDLAGIHVGHEDRHGHGVRCADPDQARPEQTRQRRKPDGEASVERRGHSSPTRQRIACVDAGGRRISGRPAGERRNPVGLRQ